jgi:hypothetical protein
MNVHNVSWLKYSSHESSEGKLLQATCQELGLKQLVKEPTREGNLLDLALSDVPGATAIVSPSIADHNIVETSLKFKVPEHHEVKREVWQFAKADWDRLRDELAETPWSRMESMGADEAAEMLTSEVLRLSEACIPKRKITEKKSTHPWLTDKVEQLVREKVSAAGTDAGQAAAEACSAGIREEHEAYVQNTRKELAALPRGSKAWWSKSRELSDQRGKCSSIPALRNGSGGWVLDASGKAELFSNTFSKKYKLIEREENEYSHLLAAGHSQDMLHTTTVEEAERVLGAVKVSSSTGPDMLPARILKICAVELAVPMLLLAQAILLSGIWPAIWLAHWIVPLYKKNSVFKAENYRGIHLTAQMSKAMERAPAGSDVW